MQSRPHVPAPASAAAALSRADYPPIGNTAALRLVGKTRPSSISPAPAPTLPAGAARFSAWNAKINLIDAHAVGDVLCSSARIKRAFLNIAGVPNLTAANWRVPAIKPVTSGAAAEPLGEAVAQKIEAQHRQADRQAGHGGKMRRHQQEGAAFIEHPAPGRLWRRNPQAEKGQRGFGDNDATGAKTGLHGERRRHAGQ